MEYFSHSTSGITLSSVFFFVFAMVTLVGNAMVIAKTVRSKTLQGQVSRVFIVNLSIADSAIGLLLVILALIASGFKVGQVTETWCRTVCAAIYCCITASTLTLACISIERYIRMLGSLTRGSLLTRGRVRVTIGYTWLQGLMTGCTPLALEWIIDSNILKEVGQAQLPLKFKMFLTMAAFVLCLLLPSAALLTYYNYIVSDLEKDTESPGRAGPKAAFPALPTKLYDKTSADHTRKAVESMLAHLFVFFSFMTPLSFTDCFCEFTWTLLPYASANFWLHIMVLWQVLLIPLYIIIAVKTSVNNARKCLNI